MKYFKILLLIAFSYTASAQSIDNTLILRKGYTLFNKANIRSKPNIDSDLILVLKKNEEVIIVDTNKEFNPYWKIRYKDTVGFVLLGDIKEGPKIKEYPTIGTTPRIYKSRSTRSGCSTVQCRGRTDKGHRCKNRTTNCSGRCHYHN